MGSRKRVQRKAGRSSRFPQMSLLEALERSVRYSHDLKASVSATVQSARVLARKIDADPDSVTASMMQTFLKYCEALGFTIEPKQKSDGKDSAKPSGGAPSPMSIFMRKFETK